MMYSSVTGRKTSFNRDYLHSDCIRWIRTVKWTHFRSLHMLNDPNDTQPSFSALLVPNENKIQHKKMKSKLENAILDSMSKNPNNWKGIFYFNPNDPRILVRKINPRLGWSYNWASPYSYISFICIILITAACFIFLK